MTLDENELLANRLADSFFEKINNGLQSAEVYLEPSGTSKV